MPIIRYEDREYACADNQTVLDSLLEQGTAVPHGCRSGFCQSCMMQAVTGEPGALARKGLEASLQAQGYFLPCICRPRDDLTVRLPPTREAHVPAQVVAVEHLSGAVARLRLRPALPVEFRPGQYLTVYRDRLTGRSYSLAGLPSEPDLEIHVRRMAGGIVSPWLYDLTPGAACELGGVAGDSFYCPGKPQQPLLLVGTGTGLAPLYGILRDALAQGHSGPIRLYHGSRHAHGLYLDAQLRALTERHPNVHYVPCVSGGEMPAGTRVGRADQMALADHRDLTGWRVFLCGHPDMVRDTRKRAFLAGAAMDSIHTDPFFPAQQQTVKVVVSG